MPKLKRRSNTNSPNNSPDSKSEDAKNSTIKPQNSQSSVKIKKMIANTKSINSKLYNKNKCLYFTTLGIALLSIVFLVQKVSSLTWHGTSFNYYEIKKLILNTYGSEYSKLKPLYKTRSALKEAKDNHNIKKILGPSDFNYLENKIWKNYTIENFKKHHLNPMLIERVSGTEGNQKVVDFITSSLPKFYEVTLDTSVQRTALGDDVKFQNVIATSNKYAERQLIVACHFDSKYWPNKNEVFIGATDSAVPCAMMIQMAWNLNHEVMNQGELGLVFVFFDGEEAFVNWSDTDSVYGSKNMAKRWSQYYERTLANRNLGKNNKEKIRKIDRINCFILLDLIGNSNPSFSHDRQFAKASQLFLRMGALENHPFLQKKFKNKNNNRPYFNLRNVGRRNLYIDDDHMPWYRAGLREIVHLIPTPFPFTWHRTDDNESNLDYDTIYNLQLILDTFVVEYMNLIE